MKLERSSWAGRTMLVVFFFALILSCGAGDVHAAVNSSAKTSASTGKGSTSKVKKGLIWEKGGYRYYVNNKPVRNTWKIIKGKYYWFRENGVAARGGACNVPVASDISVKRNFAYSPLAVFTTNTLPLIS